MNNKIKKRITIIGIILAIFSCNIDTVLAAHFGVSVSNNGNGTMTVSVSGNVVGGFSVSAGGKSATMSIRNIGGSDSVTLNTGAGTHSVVVTGISLSDEKYNVFEGETVSKTVTVTTKSANSSNGGGTTTPKDPVKPVESNKNKDSSLSSLGISTGTLSPKFSAGTTSYKVDLPATTTSLKVSASAKDAKASVSGTGEKKLKAGNNTINVVCTAENGSTTTYTIKAYVDEKPLAFAKYNGSKLGISRNSDKAPALSKAFSKTSLMIDGVKVDAWKNGTKDVTLLYMQGSKGNDYYIYDEAKKELVSVYRPVAVLGHNLVLVDVPKDLQTREGMTFAKVKIGKEEFPGWTFKDDSFKNYAVIYAMNEAGKYEYYQYEKSEGILQIYSGSAAITQKEYEVFSKDLKSSQDTNGILKLVLYGLGALSAGLLVLSIVLGTRKKKPKKFDRIHEIEKNIPKETNIEAESLTEINDGKEEK